MKKGRRRPATVTARFELACTPEEKDRLRATAAALGVTPSVVLRELIRQHLDSSWKVEVPYPIANDQALRLLRRAGANINQIAKALHAGQAPPPFDAAFEQLREAILALTRTVR